MIILSRLIIYRWNQIGTKDCIIKRLGRICWKFLGVLCDKHNVQVASCNFSFSCSSSLIQDQIFTAAAMKGGQNHFLGLFLLFSMIFAAWALPNYGNVQPTLFHLLFVYHYRFMSSSNLRGWWLLPRFGRLQDIHPMWSWKSQLHSVSRRFILEPRWLDLRLELERTMRTNSN